MNSELDYLISYAQNREDVIIDSFFTENYRGVYVDVGAGDPTIFSVTKYFYEKGWRGINIEPNHAMYAKLLEERPEDTNLEISAGSEKGKKMLRIYEGVGLSTLSDDMKQEHIGGDVAGSKEYQDTIVEVDTLAEILAAAKILHIDFMNIDVEGYEYEVILGNDWNKYRPKVICIEANHRHSDWRPLLEKAAYNLSFYDGLNEYYIDGKANPKPEFNYIKRVIGRPSIPAIVASDIEQKQKKIQHLNAENTRLRGLKDANEERMNYLEAYILEQSRLKKIIKNLIIKVHTIIVLRLTKSFRGKKRYPLITEENFDVESLLKAIKASDRAAFTIKPSVLTRLKTFLAKLLYAVYRLITRGIYVIVRFVIRRLRTLRHHRRMNEK